MNVFVFQSVPERYDLRKHLQPGERDVWYATRYRNQMSPGDIVLFWMAGDEHFRGLYGWGKLVSIPYLKAGWDSHGVDVIYEAKFSKPLLATRLRSDPLLSDLLIFRAPQATNFLIPPNQVKRLRKCLEDYGYEIPELKEVK